jgi:hypothetical protein
MLWLLSMTSHRVMVSGSKAYKERKSTRSIRVSSAKLRISKSQKQLARDAQEAKSRQPTNNITLAPLEREKMRKALQRSKRRKQQQRKP